MSYPMQTSSLTTCDSRFIISRQNYPEYYTGTNEFGYSEWVSNRDQAMQIREHNLVERMKSITGHGEISATLVSQNDRTDRRLPPPQTTESTQTANGGSRSIQ
jgi:hypothetical protein